MNLLEETKFLMRKYKIQANKNLGQNFLIDYNVISDIIDGADISQNDLVIEIGPGLGSMTALLLEKAKKVICIELDPKMVQIIHDRFIAYDNIEVINEDILKIDLNNIINDEKEKIDIRKVKVVANLPYYITTPIIMKLVEDNLELDSITVMIQKEVADRLIEIPGGKNTGAITYSIFYHTESKKIRDVSKESFIPEPKVDSEVITLNLRKEPAVVVKDKKLFFNIIKVAFMQRRKTLINSLTNAGIFKCKEEGLEILSELDFAEDVRPEKLRIEDFASISDRLS